MNNNYNGTFFPGGPLYSGNIMTPDQSQAPSIDPFFEQSYIENILRANKGKKVTVFTSCPDSIEWKDRKFKGIIEESGRDHILLSDPTTGNWYMILMIYVDYIEFEERINYNKDFISTN
jgi:spore germination protein Q